MTENLSIDGVTLEVGDKIAVFLVASDVRSLAEECDKSPLAPEEELIEIDANYFRRALIVGASDSKDNGMVFIPWDATKNARVIARSKASPVLDGVYRVSSGSWADATTQLKKAFGFPLLDKPSI